MFGLCFLDYFNNYYQNNSVIYIFFVPLHTVS